MCIHKTNTCIVAAKDTPSLNVSVKSLIIWSNDYMRWDDRVWDILELAAIVGFTSPASSIFIARTAASSRRKQVSDESKRDLECCEKCMLIIA